MKPWQRFLFDTADMMELVGHASGTVLDEYGGMCVTGAMSMVAHGRVDKFLDEYLRTYCSTDFAKNTVMVQAFIMLQKHYRFPVQWNNENPGEKVIAGIRECASGEQSGVDIRRPARVCIDGRSRRGAPGDSAVRIHAPLGDRQEEKAKEEAFA